MSLAHALEIIEGLELFSSQLDGQVFSLSFILFYYSRKFHSELLVILYLHHRIHDPLIRDLNFNCPKSAATH